MAPVVSSRDTDTFFKNRSSGRPPALIGLVQGRRVTAPEGNDRSVRMIPRTGDGRLPIQFRENAKIAIIDALAKKLRDFKTTDDPLSLFNSFIVEPAPTAQELSALSNHLVSVMSGLEVLQENVEHAKTLLEVDAGGAQARGRVPAQPLPSTSTTAAQSALKKANRLSNVQLNEILEVGGKQTNDSNRELLRTMLRNPPVQSNQLEYLHTTLGPKMFTRLLLKPDVEYQDITPILTALS